MMRAPLLTGASVTWYRIAAPSSWAKAMLSSLHAILRALLPEQARGQRPLAIRDRQYHLTADIGPDTRVELLFDGELLGVAFVPAADAIADRPGNDTLAGASDAKSTPANRAA